VTYRYATQADVLAFYGRPHEMSMRAVAVIVDEQPVGIIGLAMGVDCCTLFADSKPEIEPYLKSMAVYRAIALAMKLVKQSKRTVLAIRQPGTDILPRLGFEHVQGEVYRWPS